MNVRRDLLRQHQANTAWGGMSTLQKLDSIDADRYLPPTAPAEKGQSGGGQSADTEIPTEDLQSLNLSGKLEIGQLYISGLSLQAVRADFRARDGIVAVDPSSANVYGGQYSGGLTIDASGAVPTVTIRQALRKVQVGGLAAIWS